jgi:hypothetical protein
MIKAGYADQRFNINPADKWMLGDPGKNRRIRNILSFEVMDLKA